MANIPIWSGTATFDPSQNPTAFGFYDNDPHFQSDAPSVASWCAQRLGYPLVDVELQQENFFTAFEEAITEYGAQVYQFQIINNLERIKGYSTGSVHEDGLNQIDVSSVYGTSVGGSGGGGGGSGTTYNLTDSKLYSASLSVKRGQQKYNLLSSTPTYASATLEWGDGGNPSGSNVFGALAHSSSITLTDTNGVTVHYRAMTGSSDGIMVTGSGEFRRYLHASASVGNFITGSYAGTSLGLSLDNSILGQQGSEGDGNLIISAGNLSASVDSFISTIENGPHSNSFTISSSLSSSGNFFITLTQTVEGTGGNTQITSSLTDNATGLSADVTVPATFTGGSSGLSFEASGSQILSLGKRITIKKIYHYQPAAINRYFDPYAGTGTGIQSLMQTFGFGNYSPGVNFMLMPMYFDALKLQAIEMNDKIRKSAYHFELNSGKYLKLFPIPTSDYKLWFEYTMAASSNDLTSGVGAGETGDDDIESPRNTITDMSNVPYKRPTYEFINSPGRQWIRKYCLAICKEMLGGIRGKYQTIPIPGDDTTLDYSRLLSEALSEKSDLITQLREDLDATTTLSQRTRLSDEASAEQSGYQVNNPYQIYIH